VSHGLGPLIFDIFLLQNEQRLVQLLAERDLTTVFCVGNGISLEPRALAYAGLQVIALNASPIAVEIARDVPADDRVLQKYFDSPYRHPGGTISFVVGDLFDATAYPGPFDVIIERRTLQLFASTERERALDSLSARLVSNGVFVSQAHMGWWRPGEPRDHPAEGWFRSHGFAIYRRAGGSDVASTEGKRLAWLTVTTG
jgi:SAM-dependent methyltransferase